MDLNKVLKALMFVHKSYPAMKLAWEGQLDVPDEKLPLISPSHYLKELSMTTEERLDTLCKQQRKFEYWEPGTDFIIVPTVVAFQRFVPGKAYSLTLSIRNISKRTQKIALLMDNCSEFSLDERSVQVSKFAPGMIFKATINFNPQEDRDYFQKMVIVTKDSRFAVPLLGIGSRGILCTPDTIDFMKVPVKYLKTKVTTMTNVGDRPARFILSTTGPFCVTPERGIVNPKESFSMDVSFYSEKKTVAQGLLHIQYENSEQVTVDLKAEAINDSIYISPSRLALDDTYIGLKTFATVDIINRTSVVAQFRWKKFISQEWSKQRHLEPDHRKPSLHAFQRFSTAENQNALEPHVSCHDCNLLLDMGNIEDETDALFVPGDFLIEPVWGKVQPYSSSQCIVVFCPYKPERYHALAYCDITGHENRFVLKLTGRGIEPKFTFGFDENFIPLPIAGAQNNQAELVTEEALFDIAIGNQPAGQIRIGLFGNTVPKTVKNFATICSAGVNGKTYAGSAFHRVIKRFMIQGGDIIRGDGTGSTSIYGGKFEDENFNIKHTGPGFLSMANSGPNTNGCQFFITAVATPWLDGHHVVFGKVVDGLNLVKQIENSPTGQNDRPATPVVISKCSVNKVDPYELRLGGNE